ncbi:uncharacterized protein Z518_00230 [Rhinocladiella mackenziei CBS 650.93]|uniref:Rhinocladiella mackenziei CBS 650.93 unplaced genomic scaffold supercont1.1, whole genome shotgun sequence n=1 Tax=Rhinocladiella mackenziei CBS 650.93 TaxID=1442369 RepID=A0A0D2G3J0_9EURO|nr:uncharacterized protein Z518_00230 [Rhinocladiella mackenziei CBS 650.93]KIX09152.1 hypothetical protein Z518_00230 [Rhinocladiella mackenziei CBS 650.93]
MTIDIPGYYFDKDRNRYFKIQPNQNAPAGSDYSRQAVNAREVIDHAERREESARLSKNASTIKRSQFLQHPLLALDKRLGNLQRAGTFVAEYYAAGLAGASALSPFDSWQEQRPASHFDVEEHLGSLFTAFSDNLRGQQRRPVSLLMGLHRHTAASAHRDILFANAGFLSSGNDSESCLYHSKNCELVRRVPKVDYVHCVAPGLVCWTIGSSAGFNRSQLEFSRYYGRDTGRQSDFWVTLTFDTLIWGLASSPSKDWIALATGRGVYLVSNLNSNSPVTESRRSSEQRSITFKDENVFLAGARTGKVTIGDRRAGACQTRLQHSSAASALATLPDGNRVIVSGLPDTKIYDLRFTSAPSSTYKSHGRTMHAPSNPYVTFNIPPTRQQKQYGLGFAYDPELNIVLSTSTDNHRDNRVGLWSVATGQLLEGPLSKHKFRQPVTCARIVQVRDGPKSILLATAGEIQEWTPQGGRLGDVQE